MLPPSPEQISSALETLFRTDSGRILASLIRLLGDLDLAEEAMHEAFAAALESWPRTGIPANPRPWIISTARFRAIDTLRRRDRFNRAEQDLIAHIENLNTSPTTDDEIEDDRLRLIFTCCHPSLAPEAQTALTLREVCGLTTEAIAHAFLTKPSTLAQRIVRAKSHIREQRIPFQVPSTSELPTRLAPVLLVVYLIFNQGYSEPSSAILSREAIRLARILLALLPEPEVAGLLALMLLQESRRPARTATSGDIILLEHQDRTLWDRALITEGIALTEQALASHRFGVYTLQAAIAAVHAESTSPGSTDWHQITLLYDRLLALQPSPVIELNRAVAVAMHLGPQAGLDLIEPLLPQLGNYHLAHAAHADLNRRLGNITRARASYTRALALAPTEPERRFLIARLNEK